MPNQVVMKRIDRKTLLIMAVLGTIVLVADIVLFFALEAISGTAFGITALISAPLAVIPFLLFYAPDEMGEIWKDSDFERSNWLPRTKESTLFEAAAALILIILWAIVLASHTKELEMPVLITVVVIALLISAYNANSGRYSIWRGKKNMKQSLIRARLTRIVAVVIALFGMLSLIPGVNTIFVGVAFFVIVILTYIGAFVINK